MNIQEIKSTHRIEDIIGNYVSLKKQGPELVGNCVFHEDQHASMKVNPVKQIFKCFACNSGGDLLDFFTLQGKTLPEAIDIITSNSIIQLKEYEKKQPIAEWKNAIPDQNNLPNPLLLKFGNYGNPSNYWAYHDINGNVISYVCRFDLPDGKKDVIPYSFKTDGSEFSWKWKGLDTPRPLYDLHKIIENPDKIILLVEGEKTAEAAKKLFPNYVCTTWIGGANGVKNTDWKPLYGRKIYLWNDNDIAGLLAMFGGWSFNEKTKKYSRVIGISEMFEASFKRIQNSVDFPKKWDIADAEWNSEQAQKYLKENRVDIPKVSEFAPDDLPKPEKIEIQNEYVKPEVEVIEHKNHYFRCLGFENNEQNLYVFFVYRTNVIVKLSASGISTANLLQLAPLNYWEGEYPKTTRSAGTKFDLNQIMDFLITTCSNIGIFNPSKIRGRGAWIDNKLPVLHCGDSLIVDGKYLPFSKHKSKFIYEAGQELGFELTKPLKKNEAHKLIELLDRINFSRDIDARLLAGWITIAPLCGALNWRPHIWLTGASGSGKSEVMKLFVKPFLGEMLVDAQSETTEAGIRQFLKTDALPVVFDEAESEDKKGLERMQSVLNLMRASSTSDSGKIIKGSSGGSASEFNIKSCFAFASIGANLTQRSDTSRITVIEIKTDESENKREKWAETLELYAECIDNNFIRAFQSRALLFLPTILKNAKTFSNITAIELDNQRTGDQIGILLAGAYLLYSDEEISIEDAKKFVKQRDWTQEKLSDATKDEVKILNKIMDSEIGFDAPNGKITRTIGELVIRARGDVIEERESFLFSEELAKSVLKRQGIRVESFCVIISDNSEFIRKSLIETAYSRNYHTVLARISGAEKINSVIFGSGTKSTATKIDSRIIFGNYENPGIKE